MAWWWWIAVALGVLGGVVCTLNVLMRRDKRRWYKSSQTPEQQWKAYQETLRAIEAIAPVTGHDSPRFDVEDPAALDYLRERGYVVYKEVASPADLARIKELFWDWAEQLKSPIKREDPNSWENLPCSSGTGIIASNGVGQAGFMWHARGLPSVKRAFEKIWATDELLTSFDGCGVFRPWNYNGYWRTQGGWWHVDQNTRSGKRGMQAVQGLLTVYDATDSVGGLCVIPTTHLMHDELCERNGLGTKHDFIKVNLDDPALRASPAILIHARAGDLVLWDSRTVHCNSPAIVEPAPYNPGDPLDLIRLALYICMTPRSKATDEVIQRRIEAYETTATTTHWPHLFCQSSAATHTPPVPLSPLQRGLVGYAD